MLRQDKVTMYFILIIISVVCFGLIYWNFIGINQILSGIEDRISNIPQIKEGNIEEIRQTKQDVVKELDLLDSPHGLWPIIEVQLSANRGNPFAERQQ